MQPQPDPRVKYLVQLIAAYLIYVIELTNRQVKLKKNIDTEIWTELILKAYKLKDERSLLDFEEQVPVSCTTWRVLSTECWTLNKTDHSAIRIRESWILWNRTERVKMKIEE